MMKMRMKSIAMFTLSTALALTGTFASLADESTESIYKTFDSSGRVRYVKWMTDDKGDWYQYTDDGSYPKGQWIWISPVKYYATCLDNGEAECVYIKDDGYAFNTDYGAAILAGVPYEEACKLLSLVSPDGYGVSITGKWVTREGVFNEKIVTRHFSELESH